MSKQFIKRIAEELQEVAKEAKPVGEAEFVHIRLHDGVGYSLSNDSSIKFNDIVAKILKHKDFIKRFSSNYIENQLKEIFAELLISSGYDLENKIEILINELATYNKPHIVYLKVEGVKLSFCFKIGKVKFVPGDIYLLKNIYEKTTDIFYATKNTPEEQQSAIDLVEKEINKELSNACVAIFEINAEPKRAYDVAKEETRRAIDLLRYASKAIYGVQDDVRIGLKGDHPKSLRQGFIFSETSFSPESDSVGSIIPYEINTNTLKVFENIGVFKVSETLSKPQANDLEESILKGIHWFSVALTQNENSNSFLFLIVALESIFKPQRGNSIGGTVAESVAFLLSDNLDGRKQLLSIVRDYYGKRSGVAHGGNKTIADQELFTLIYIVFTTIKAVIDKSTKMKSQKELMNFIEEIKLK